MKKHLYLILGITVSFLSFSCNKEQPTVLSVSQTSLTFGKEGGTQTVVVSANKIWTASSDQGWCRVSPSSGDGSKSMDTSVSIACEANQTSEIRTCTISVKSEEKQVSIVVKQDECDALLLSQTEYEVSSDAQVINLNVLYNVDFDIEIDAACKDWISIAETKALSTQGYTVSVAENDTYESRKGKITFKQRGGNLSGTITIKQAQNDALIVENDEYELTKEEQHLNIAVKSNLEYEVVIPDDCKHWISVVGTKALNESTISLKIAANIGTEDRRGSIILKSGSIQQTITISQTADDYVEFDEGAFKTFCLDNYDTNRDNKISYREAFSVTEMFFKLPGSCRDDQVSFKGIEHFTQLENLHITTYEEASHFWDFHSAPRDVRLSNLDLNECTKLSCLFCNGWIIESLSLQDYNALNYLVIEYCSINELSMKNLPTLAIIVFSYITSPENIEISDMPSLTSLYCSWSSFKELIINNSIALHDVVINNNQLECLDFSNCNALQSLKCIGNQLDSLDIGNCNALQSLDCSQNQLESLTISNGDALQKVLCSGNPIVHLNLSNLPLLSVIRYPNDAGLKTITFDNIGITTFNLSPYITTYPEVIVTNCSKLEDVKISGYQGGPYVSVLNISKCSKLSSFMVELTASDIVISDCDALEEISILRFHSSVKNLSISNCKSLKSVYPCYDIYLERFNVSNCQSLERINIGGNSISSLDVSTCPALKDLSCYDNQLTTLDISNNLALERLDCDGNLLRTLDVSNNLHIYKLWCRYNPYLNEIWLKAGQVFESFLYDKDVATLYYKD